MGRKAERNRRKREASLSEKLSACDMKGFQRRWAHFLAGKAGEAWNLVTNFYDEYGKPAPNAFKIVDEVLNELGKYGPEAWALEADKTRSDMECLIARMVACRVDRRMYRLSASSTYQFLMSRRRA